MELLQKDTVGTSELWKQWGARNKIQTVLILPTATESAYFETHQVDQDTYEDYRADRTEMLRKYGIEVYKVSQQASREAYWITRWERGGPHTARYALRLANAGYTI